jgi:PAS domain S-box-containing protein
VSDPSGEPLEKPGEAASARPNALAAAMIERAVDERLQELIAGVPCVIWEATGRPVPGPMQVTFINAYVERLLGYPPQHWLTTPGFWQEVTHEAERERVARQMTEAMESCCERFIEFRVRRKDGQVRWLETGLVPIFNGQPEATGLRGVAVDITHRKEAEAAVEKRAREFARLASQLKKTNEELDQFAYITSHDLKAPLRGIANLSRWIEEDMGQAMSPDAHRQMELLRGRVQRMENLIDGLLQYSRVGRVFTYVEEIDVSKLVAGIVDLLSPPAGFCVEVEETLPVLKGEKIRLQQVFMNLIGNAIKHHHRPEQGRVTIRCADLGRWYRFEVSDNGPGIAKRFHEKIFVIFQTLLPRDEREGAGVGLSLVRKIVEDQGGTVEVDSEEGRGATFRFLWSKHRPER